MIISSIPLDQLVNTTIYRSSGQASGVVGGQPVDATPVKVYVRELAHIEKLGGGRAERQFGLDSKARWKGIFSMDLGIEENDLIVVEEGPYEGTILEVDSIEVPFGEIKTVKLVDTDRTIT